MKRLFSVLLAITFVVSALAVPVFATYADQTSTAYIQYGTTAHDLRAYGLHTFTSYRLEGVVPTLNGVIDPSEYGGTPSDVASIANGGLTLTNNTATTDYTAEFGEAYKDVEITTYLAYNEEYAFIAEKVVSPFAFDIGNKTLSTNVRYGLNQSEAIPEAASRLSNTYEYGYLAGKLSPFDCTFGNRTYKLIEGQVSKSVTLDNESYEDWTTGKYSMNTAIGYTAQTEGEATVHTYEIEYVIPLNDLIFSAVGSFDEEAVKALLEKAEFFGSYMFQISVTRNGGSNGKTALYLTTGFAGSKELAPYTENSNAKSVTWAKAVRDYWTTEKGDSLSVVYVPSPVVHFGKQEAGAEAPALPPATSFRPGLTGYAFNEFSSVYKIGEKVTFSVTPDCIENTSPVVGDTRVVPTKFRVRNGYDTKLTGTFDADMKTAHFDTQALPVGLNTLVVTFTQQRFDGTQWVDTAVTKNLSKNFTVAGSVLGAVTSASAQTGDNTLVFVVAGSAMILTAAAFTFVTLGKKRI